MSKPRAALIISWQQEILQNKDSLKVMEAFDPYSAACQVSLIGDFFGMQ